MRPTEATVDTPRRQCDRKLMARWRPKNARRNREEWIGGRVSLAGKDVLIWMSYPEDVVVYYQVVDPAAPTTLGEALLRAMEAPLVGEPRRPGRIRVATAREVRDVREHVGTGILVAQAATPEIDFLLEQMEDFRKRGVTASWLGEVPELDVTGFFDAARLLHSVAPWKALDEDCLVRVDSPELGLEGAVVSLMGHDEQELGFLLFPSMDAYDAFLEGARRSMARGERADLGTTWLSLSYDDAGVVSPQLLADMRERGLQAARAAHPSPYSHGTDGRPLPLRAEDVRTIEAVALALAHAFDTFGTDMFDEIDPSEPVNATYRAEAEGSPSVELTIPYWMHPDEDLVDGGEAGFDDDTDLEIARTLHELDRELVELLCAYGRERVGESWDRELERLSSRHPFALVRDFVAYRQEHEGKTLAASLLEELESVDGVQREWLDAQRESWLSAWEVTGVDVGTGLELRDLLSGEERYVLEVGATETLHERLVILGRVIACQGLCLLGAAHPQPLRPLDADRVVQAIRKRLRKKGDVPVERLRASAITEHLMDEWANVVSDVVERANTPPVLHNTDGDALLLTVDHFELVDPGSGVAIDAALESLPGARRDGNAVVLVRPNDDATLVARVVLDGTRLRIETNSIARADELRALVEANVGQHVRHRARTHSDPVAFFGDAKANAERGEATGPLDPTIPEVRDAVMSVKKRHLQKWVDEPVPALDGETPREASQSADGRRKLDVLLREIELIESQSPEGLRLDLAPVRRELGL